MLLGSTNSAVLKVVSTPEGEAPQGCITQCVGSTGVNTTWGGTEEYVFTYFDIAACSFVAGTTPMVSASLVGVNSFIVGNPGVQHYSGSRCEVLAVRLERYKSRNMLQDARTGNWRIDWEAVGRSC